METEKDTKQILPDNLVDYLSTILAFDTLCNAVMGAVDGAAKGKKEHNIMCFLSKHLGNVFDHILVTSNLLKNPYNTKGQYNLEAIGETLASDELQLEFVISEGIFSCQEKILEAFRELTINIYPRFSNIVDVILLDAYSSTLANDLEDYDGIIMILTCCLLMHSYLSSMVEKFYGQSEYPEDFLSVQREVWNGLNWLEDIMFYFSDEMITNLAIMCRHIQPLSIVRGMQHIYRSLPNLLKAHIGGVDIYIDDIIAEKIEELDYLECLLTLEKEESKNWFPSHMTPLISNRLIKLIGKRMITENPKMSDAILEMGNIPYCLSFKETLEYLQSSQNGTLYLKMFQTLEFFLEQVLFFSMKYPADRLTKCILEAGYNTEEDWKTIRALQDTVEEETHLGEIFEDIILGTYEPSSKEDERSVQSDDDPDALEEDDFDMSEDEEEPIDLLSTDKLSEIRDFFRDVYLYYQSDRMDNYDGTMFDVFIADGDYIKEMEFIDNVDWYAKYQVVIDGDYYNSYYNYDRAYLTDKDDPINYDTEWTLEAEDGEPIRNRVKQCEAVYLYRSSHDFIHSTMKDMIEYSLDYFADSDRPFIEEAKYKIREEWKRVGTGKWKEDKPFKVNLKAYKTMYQNIGTILLNVVDALNSSRTFEYSDYLEDGSEKEVFLAGMVGLAKLMYPMFIMMVQSDVNSVLDEGYDIYTELPEDVTVEDMLYILHLAVKAFVNLRVQLTEKEWFSHEESHINEAVPLEHIEDCIQKARKGTIQTWNDLKATYICIKKHWIEPDVYWKTLKDQLFNDTKDMSHSEYESYQTIFHTYENSLRGLERIVRCYIALYPVVLRAEYKDGKEN